MGFFMPGWIWRNLFHHLLLVDRSSRRLSVDTVDTGHLKTRFLILQLAVIQSRTIATAGATRDLFSCPRVLVLNSAISAHGKEKIRECVFIFCATSITGQLETQQDEM